MSTHQSETVGGPSGQHPDDATELQGVVADGESDLAMNCYTCHRGEEMPVIPWDTAHIKAKPIPVQTSPWGNYKQ